MDHTLGTRRYAVGDTFWPVLVMKQGPSRTVYCSLRLKINNGLWLNTSHCSRYVVSFINRPYVEGSGSGLAVSSCYGSELTLYCFINSPSKDLVPESWFGSRTRLCNLIWMPTYPNREVTFALAHGLLVGLPLVRSAGLWDVRGLLPPQTLTKLVHLRSRLLPAAAAADTEEQEHIRQTALLGTEPVPFHWYVGVWSLYFSFFSYKGHQLKCAWDSFHSNCPWKLSKAAVSKSYFGKRCLKKPSACYFSINSIQQLQLIMRHSFTTSLSASWT